MNIQNAVFRRRFAKSMYKNLKLSLCEMTFTKDFVSDSRGDLYPILDKSSDCIEHITQNSYLLEQGSIQRYMGQFFPYATYEVTFETEVGKVGLGFKLPECEAKVLYQQGQICLKTGDQIEQTELPCTNSGPQTLIVTCRPGYFDVYWLVNGAASFVHTFRVPYFADSNLQSSFEQGHVSLCAVGAAKVTAACGYIDSGVSQADYRPIRYENGEIMIEQGKIYFTGSIRMQAQGFQGVFSWVPGTSQIELVGAMFFDCGDGKWCGDVASSILYHRPSGLWYHWVCSFSHGHILGHACYEGDPRFGVNVVDIQLMPAMKPEDDIYDFVGLEGDEDPDFFYDAKEDCWYMAICRVDPTINRYRYVFYKSNQPFEGYEFIGKGLEGAETGGSFVHIENKVYFVCGNDFNAKSDYRIYSEDGMVQAKFDFPDGGFRGWGTVMPIRMGSRKRYFWLTFDRHNGSDFNWSYGNLYCFEATE